MVLRLPPWWLRGRDELQQLLEPCATFGALPLWQGSNAAASATAFSHVFALSCMSGGPDEQTLCAAVKRWAIESLDMPAIFQPLQLGGVHDFSAAECRRVLAAGFVGNVVDTMADAKRNQGGINFSKLVRDCAVDTESIGAHKLAALLLYFAAGLALEGTADDERQVRFERIACPPLAEFEAMLTAEEAAGTRPEWSDVVSLHDGGMEAVAEATAFVNFANADFGYGCFIPSCTQEEILQMACPEFNVGMLMLGRMGEDEVVNVRGCRRFSTYAGYLGTYTCTGSLVTTAAAASPPVVVLHDVLTLDACTTQHFRRERQLRDLRKAYASFAALGQRAEGGPAVVSTGRWGCGVFGGLPAHKFAQQAVAARLAGVRLRFSTFGTPDGCDAVLGALQASGASVPRTFEALLRCADRRAFEESFVPMLRAAAGGAAGEPPGDQGVSSMV